MCVVQLIMSNEIFFEIMQSDGTVATYNLNSAPSVPVVSIPKKLPAIQVSKRKTTIKKVSAQGENSNEAISGKF